MARNQFITDEFLLANRTARKLYHEYAEGLPIIDYHSHLPPDEIAQDRRFDNLTQIWLNGDHYKWRAMRSNGIDEHFITGKASDWEKFERWAETVPKTLRNPLYHWTHLELKRFFGIGDRLLNPKTAKGIWNECNARLRREEFSCRGLLKKMNVVVSCTTDDPADNLDHHRALANDASFPVRVLPTWRPDAGMAVESRAGFNAWVNRLAGAAKVEIRNYDDYLRALRKRHDCFHGMGCRLSDHGVETVCAEDYTEAEIRKAFARIRGGAELAPGEVLKFKSAMLHEFAVMDAEKGWTQQFHMGVLRNPNSRAFRALGPNTGFDCIGDFEIARPLAKFLDGLDRRGKLPKTILYNINPRDNETLAAVIGSFQDGRVPGKLQFGAAWWFLDQKDGMEKQLNALSNLGLLSRFVGMATDSRSFLSFPRHEYFRRVLCNMLGSDMEQGLLPGDFDLVGGIVEDICYNNAATYFGFDNIPDFQKRRNR